MLNFWCFTSLAYYIVKYQAKKYFNSYTKSCVFFHFSCQFMFASSAVLLSSYSVPVVSGRAVGRNPVERHSLDTIIFTET